MKPLTASALLLLALPVSGATLTGLWEFDNPGNVGEASVGSDLIFEGAAPAHAAALGDDGANALSGVITTADAVNTNTIRADHGIAPNGGGAFVNQYSIVADIFSPPGSRNSWRTIYQTNTGNSNDGEYFLRPDNDHLGVGELGYSDAPIDETTWTRLVITIDLTLAGNDALTYLDGALHYTHPGNPAADGRFALDPFLYFFTDENGDNAPLHVAALAIFEGVLSEAEVAALGVAGDPITNPPPPVDPPVVTAQAAGPATLEAGTSAEFDFLATDPNGEDVEIQVEWGNGVSSPWSAAGPSGVTRTISYAYPRAGIFNIRARARDSGGSVSDYVDLQSITVTALPTKPAVLTGLWNFDAPAQLGKATVGNDLSFEGVEPTYSASLADDGGNSLTGVITTATPDNANRIRADHGIAPNGGGSLVNQYSIVADIFSPAESRNSWRTIFQTDPTNSNDGEYFLSPDDAMGVGALTYGPAIDEIRWTRLVITIDLALGGNDALTYLDGALHYTHTSDPALDSRFALDSFLYFFTDENGENAPLAVGSLAIYEGVLTPEEVALLGPAGTPLVPEARIKITGISFDGSTPGAETLRIGWESKDGKLYNLRSTTDPASAGPVDWPIFNANQDLVATPPENTVIISLPADPTRLFVIEEFNAPPVSIFADDFESGQGGWTTGSDGSDGTAWELGAPSNLGPASAHSPVNCFGTNLAGEYGLEANVWLRSPPIDLTTAGGATLNFYQSIDIEEGFDAGQVAVLDASDNSELAVLQGAVDGVAPDWEKATLTLPADALGKTVVIEFRFTSDDLQNFAGWYLDDVEVTVP